MSVVVSGFFAYKGNHIAKIQSKKNTPHERELLRSNYEKISKALGIIIRDATVNDEAMDILLKARHEAKLELPKEIQEYIQSLVDRAFEYRGIQRERDRLPTGPERNKVCKQEDKILGEWLEEKPYDKYSKFLKNI